jgi:tetratricopeptide (TPR) repeat protein
MSVMDYYHQGAKLIQQGDYDAAIKVFNTALGEDPDNFSVIAIRGSTYMRKGEHEKALADYTRMIALDPQDPDGWNSRGNLYHQLGEYDKAIADCTQCIPLSPPGYGTCWSNRGISYYAKGDLDAALADLNKSIECWSEPDYTQKATDDAERVLLLAQLEYIGGKDLVPQADALLRGLRSNRDEVDVLMAKSFGLCAKNDAQEAIEDLSRAIDLEPNNAEAYYQRGLAYTLMGETDKALSDYEQTCALSTTKPPGNGTNCWKTEDRLVRQPLTSSAQFVSLVHKADL